MRKVEIEGSEEVMMPNGKSFTAQGPSHENGGIPIELPVGTRVYSKRIKKDGKTMAERKQRRDASLKRMVDGAMDNPFDAPAEMAMRRMMAAYAKEEAEDMNIQERTQKKKEAEQTMNSFSSPDEMKCGGKVKKYAKGGKVEDDPTPKPRLAPQVPVTDTAKPLNPIVPVDPNTRLVAREPVSWIDGPQYGLMGVFTGTPQAPSDWLVSKGVTNPYALIASDLIIDPLNALYGAGSMARAVTKAPKIVRNILKASTTLDDAGDTVDNVIKSTEARERSRGETVKFAKGGTIKIDPAKKGTFKAQATRMGMGVQEAAEYILDNPEDFTPKMRKKANFARNFAMAYGGQVMRMEEGGEVEGMEIEDVLNAMIDERIKMAMGEAPPEPEEMEEEEGMEMEGMAEEEAPEMTEEEMAMYGMELGYGAKVMGMGGMIKRADGTYSRRGLWDNIRANRGSGKKPTKEMLEQERKIKAEDKMAEGGVVKDGTTKRSDRKGKKMAVYMDGSWHHFGDSSMDDFRTHKSEKRKDAFYSRHKKNLQGDDARSKAFRVYARKTWENGGVIPMYQDGTPGIPPQDRFNTNMYMNPNIFPDDMAGQPVGMPMPQVPSAGMMPNAGMSNLAGLPTRSFSPLDLTNSSATVPMQAGAMPTLRTLPTGIGGDRVYSQTAPSPIAYGGQPMAAPAGLNVPQPAFDNEFGPTRRAGTRLGNAIGAASQFVSQNMGPLGIAVGTLGPLAATIINRLGDKTNESFYEDYGRQGLAANARAMRGVEAGRQQSMEDINMQTANAAAQARGMGSVNAARGVQQMAGAQAMRASTTANQQAVGQQAGLMGERAGLFNTRDQMVMSGREQADVANVQDRDAFFTNLTSNLTNLGTGMLYAAKNRKPAPTASQVINKKVLG